MAMNENFMDPASEPADSKVQRSRLHPLHEAALRLAGLKGNAARTKSRDLVAMLLGHGARAWRGAQPKAHIHIYMTSPSGKRPIRLRME